MVRPPNYQRSPWTCACGSRRFARELNEVSGGFGLLRLRRPHTAPAAPSPALAMITVMRGCVVGYIVQEQIGKGWPGSIGAGLTMGGVFWVLHSRFRKHAP